MKPAGAFLVSAARNQDYTVGPLGNKIVRIVDAVTISEAAAFGNKIPLPPGANERIRAPKFGFAKEQLDQPRVPRTLSKAIAIANHDGFSGDAEHFFDDGLWVRSEERRV